MEKENRLTFIDEDGNEVLCEILFYFRVERIQQKLCLILSCRRG